MDPLDGLLVDRIAAGDDDALREALDRHGSVVHAAARRVTGQPAVAEEVTQDVFVALWRYPERYQPERGSLRSFLLVQAHRRGVDALRQHSRRAGREERHVRLNLPEQGGSGSTEIDLALISGAVRDAVRRLPPEQREVVELAYFNGLTYREVAVALGIPEGTAKSRLRLALAKLELTLDRELLELV